MLDTNVYISCFTHPWNELYRLWRAAYQGRFQLLVSPAILREVAAVLRDVFAWEETRIVQRLKAVARTAEIITPTFTLEVIQEDPADNRILECAVAGRTNLIVSGDRHLRRLRHYQGIPIVRPIDFLRTLGLLDEPG